MVGGRGVEGEGLGVPDLPVVVQRGGVVGMGVPQHNVGQPEVPGGLGGLVAGLHDPQMGQTPARQVQAGHMDAVGITLQCLKDLRRDALGGLAGVVAGEHPVDIGVVGRPEPPPHVHGELVGAGDDQNAAFVGQRPRLFQRRQVLDELGAQVHLLDLVAAQSAHDGQRLFAGGAEKPALHRQRLTVGGVQGEQNFLSHTLPPNTRAISEPA